MCWSPFVLLTHAPPPGTGLVGLTRNLRLYDMWCDTGVPSLTQGAFRPLIPIAIAHGTVAMVERLVQGSGGCNALGPTGETPLHIACRLGT
jgi:hypothetical protein